MNDLPRLSRLDRSCDLLPWREQRIEYIELKDVFKNAANGPTHSDMVRMGFEKNGQHFQRNACVGCKACMPIRLCVDRFVPGKTRRHLINANADLTIEEVAPPDFDEHALLFSAYMRARHPDTIGDGATILREIYRVPYFTAHALEFRLDGKLVGAMAFDETDDGVTANASYYDAGLSARRSLGTFMIMELARRVKDAGKAHVYLGTWGPEVPVYGYKATFRPAEVWQDKAWTPLIPPAAPR